MTAAARRAVLAVITTDLAATAEMAASRWAAPARRARDTGRSQVEELLGDRVAGHTRRGYAADWTTFTRWASGQGATVPPAAPELVAVYLAAATCAIQPRSNEPLYQRSTLLRWASSISAIHARLGHPDPCARPPARDVIACIRGFDNDRRHHARPLPGEGIRRLLDGLPEPGWPREPARRRDRLIVTLGSAAGLGPSELTDLPLAGIQIDHTTHSLVLSRGPGARTIPPAGDAAVCAACALLGWRELTDAADTTGTQAAQHLIRDSTETAGHITLPLSPVPAARADLPLIRRIRRGGTVTLSPVTPQVIRQVLRALASRAGLDPRTVTGMSMPASYRLGRLLTEARSLDR